MDKIKVIVDCFGCDFPDKVICGLAKTINEIENVVLLAAGDKAYIEKQLENECFDRSRLEFIDAPEIITNNESPVDAILRKKNSSLVRAYKTLKEDDSVKAMISAGSTGAVLVGSVVVLGKLNGVERPSLMTLLPTDNNTFTYMLDCGANVDCRAEHLLKFAQLAVEYVKSVHKLDNPTVRLLSVGTEDKKGNALIKETFELLKQSDLNFLGNMEAKTAMAGETNVIVTDGFGGNVLLKTIEGTAVSTVKRLQVLLKKHAPENVDLSFVKAAFGELFQTLDFNSMGGAILLGIKKIVVKGHGSANSDTVLNTVKQALRMVEGGFDESLKKL